MTDDDIGKLIEQLPDPIEFVTPYFAFARAIEKQARWDALEEAMRALYDAQQFEAYEVVYKILKDQSCSK